ncbi:hypothetical protein FO519_008967 [Halicephalobus sp. NKZ332]|nr:hypothetical protein FO519_008967 [Halicephalobus sp. NKZ332]
MYTGLAMADMINGLGFTVTGSERLSLYFSLVNVYTLPIMNRHECAVQVGNILLVIGSQWSAMITLSLGFERYLAVQYPIKYRHLKLRMFHGLLIASLVISIISISVAIYIGIVVQRFTQALYICTLSHAYGYEYTTFNYFITMIGHTVGFILNIIAFRIVRKARKKIGLFNGMLSKEYNKVKIILFVSLLSLIMIVLPNLFLYLSRFIKGGLNHRILGWTHCLFVLRSVFNLWVLGFGVTTFKTRFFEVS